MEENEKERERETAGKARTVSRHCCRY